ncbi:SGNH/GDSL hydrolase family protein [Caulobacter segnis]|uniref:SGNH hydrolase-type esterase domain-containing protein n=1 Tax=Caulobacter segnis TaxID=88688 RepID=A0A2W5VKD5_9CAUL|nr:SGNH/GDSL hydrolase family protein [Caulobacter segnis]PZR35785.1 MAG: hypothetical protein DI526_05715 [Caulobacter segnis]
MQTANFSNGGQGGLRLRLLGAAAPQTLVTQSKNGNPALVDEYLIKYMSQNASYIGAATIQNNYNIEDMAVSAVRLIYANHETTARTINKASVAFCWGIHTDGFTPLNSSGVPDNTLWVPITSATGLVNAASATGAATPNFDRAYTATAWQAVPSVGSGLRYMLIRTYGQITQTSLSGTLSSSGVAGGAWAGIDQGRHLTSCYKYASDGVTNPGSWTGVTFADGVCPAVVQVRSQTKGISLVGFGDSLTQGYRTGADHDSFLFKAACLASKPQAPVTWANFGVAGSQSTNFYQEALKAISGPHKPSVLVFPVSSPNDPSATTQATLDASWARAQDIAARCKAAGIVPVLWGPTPFYTTSQPAVRAQRDRAKAQCALSGTLYFDAYSVLENPSSPDTLNPAYDYGDRHYNEAGAAALGAAFNAAILGPLLAA